MKLTKNEAAVIQMALITFIETSEKGLESEPFTLEAKRLIIEMMRTAISAKEKMIEIAGIEIKLGPMTPEEEIKYVLPEN